MVEVYHDLFIWSMSQIPKFHRHSWENLQIDHCDPVQIKQPTEVLALGGLVCAKEVPMMTYTVEITFFIRTRSTWYKNCIGLVEILDFHF